MRAPSRPPAADPDRLRSVLLRPRGGHGHPTRGPRPARTPPSPPARPRVGARRLQARLPPASPAAPRLALGRPHCPWLNPSHRLRQVPRGRQVSSDLPTGKQSTAGEVWTGGGAPLGVNWKPPPNSSVTFQARFSSTPYPPRDDPDHLAWVQAATHMSSCQAGTRPSGFGRGH